MLGFCSLTIAEWQNLLQNVFGDTGPGVGHASVCLEGMFCCILMHQAVQLRFLVNLRALLLVPAQHLNMCRILCSPPPAPAPPPPLLQLPLYTRCRCHTRGVVCLPCYDTQVLHQRAGVFSQSGGKAADDDSHTSSSLWHKHSEAWQQHSIHTWRPLKRPASSVKTPASSTGDSSGSWYFSPTCSQQHSRSIAALQITYNTLCSPVPLPTITDGSTLF